MVVVDRRSISPESNERAPAEHRDTSPIIDANAREPVLQSGTEGVSQDTGPFIHVKVLMKPSNGAAVNVQNKGEFIDADAKEFPQQKASEAPRDMGQFIVVEMPTN